MTMPGSVVDQIPALQPWLMHVPSKRSLRCMHSDRSHGIHGRVPAWALSNCVMKTPAASGSAVGVPRW